MRQTGGEILRKTGTLVAGAALGALAWKGARKLIERQAAKHPTIDYPVWSRLPRMRLDVPGYSLASIPDNYRNTNGQQLYAILETRYSPNDHAQPAGQMLTPAVVCKGGWHDGSHEWELGQSLAYANTVVEASARRDWDGRARMAVPVLRGVNTRLCLGDLDEVGMFHGRATTIAATMPFDDLMRSTTFPGLVVATKVHTAQ